MTFCPRCARPLENRLIDGVTRRACATTGCGFVHWDNPLPVVAALVEYCDSLLLARNAKWPAGVFSLITGFLEKGESPEQAVVREVREELNLAGEVMRFIGHYPFVPWNQIIMAFAVAATGELRTGAEIAEVKLVSRDEIRSYPFGRLVLTRSVVDDWLDQTATAQDAGSLPKPQHSQTE